MENLVFFSDNGLNVTSANYIANLCKEKYSEWESIIDTLTFYTTTVALIGSSDINILKHGIKKEELDKIPELLDKIAKAKSLIAWLREAIKTKDYLVAKLNTEKIEKKNELLPKYPEKDKVLTEEEYYDSLPVKERNRYYSLETEAAVIGKIIHLNGVFNKARKKLSNVINNPNKVEGSGRDTIIYNYIPTLSEEEVNTVFFNLQTKHRSIQAELNSIKNKCQEAINKSKLEVQNKYDAVVEEYKIKACQIVNELDKTYDERINSINKLKIVIPNDLKDIYEEIQKLGK